MNGIIRRLRPSPAMVVACIALVFAMTGAGYAAGMLGPNTVGTKQLKRNAVISSKVKNGSLLRADFKAGQIPAGPQGPAGPAGPGGPAGPPGANGSALAYALVAANGTVDPNYSKGVTTANVSHPGTGIYCFSGLGFTVKNVVATPDFALGFIAHSRPDATGLSCGAGKAEVATYTADSPTNTDHGFSVLFN